MIKDRRRLFTVVLCLILIVFLGYSVNKFKSATKSHEIYTKTYRELDKEYIQLKSKKKKVILLDRQYDNMLRRAQSVLELENEFTKLRVDKGYLDMRNSDEYKVLQLQLGEYFENEEGSNHYKEPWNYDIEWKGKIQVGKENDGQYKIMFVYKKDELTMMIVSCKYRMKDGRFLDFNIYNTDAGMKDNFYGDNRHH